VLGTYSAELRDATKHIDIPRMINALKGLHANTYDYLIGHQPTDWEDLPSFLRATEEEGINVRVVISAPLSANRLGPSPYAYDYVRWAHELATLSLTYSNLKAMIIDDFIYAINPPLDSSGDPNGLFTVDYVSQIYTTKNAVNPDFKLLVGAYTVGVDFGGAVTPELIEAYGRYIDGIWVAHWNTEVADLQYQLKRIKDLLGSKQLQVVIYANWPEIWGGPFEEAGKEPTPEYVSDCLAIAHEYADGVSTYCLPLSADDPFYLTLYPIVSDLYGRLSSK
jgi:hypothetical protein